jgi:hypothetical protein
MIWTILLYIVIALVLLLAGFIAFRYIKVRWDAGKHSKLRNQRIQPVWELLEAKRFVPDHLIEKYARPVSTRFDLFDALHQNGLADRFPTELNSFEKAGESILATWLEFPTELGALPDEIAFLERFQIDYDGLANWVYYDVFRFRVNAPHWAAKDGWMLGVVGPYFDESKPYIQANSTFSRLNKVGEITPAAEALWVHQNISLRK